MQRLLCVHVTPLLKSKTNVDIAVLNVFRSKNWEEFLKYKTVTVKV